MKRISGVLAVATCVVAFVVPRIAPAAPVTSFECAGVAQKGTTAICTVDFKLDGFVRPSQFGTHANFHTQMASGSVTMEWYDLHQYDAHPVRERVARWVCTSPGMFVSVAFPTGGSVGTGPADLAPAPTCSEQITQQAAFAHGLQELVVTATADNCMSINRDQSSCQFHGFLQVQPASVPV